MNRTLLRLFIWILVFLAAVGAYAYWYYLLTAADAEVATLAQQVNQRSIDETSAEQAADELAQLSDAGSDIKGYFVVPDNIVSFLEQQQSLGTSLGAQMSVVSVTANPNPHPHLDLALTISGSFAAVMRTVGAIEFSPYDITVSSLNLSTTNTDTAGGWTAAMALSVGTASTDSTSSPQATP
ncbi:MAG TPA: hypothetical protein VHB93_00085 [Candidatus Paceibacterota bacterium]|nr:hypothetical protein [Candidatus Paceibacterota bacterium]